MISVICVIPTSLSFAAQKRIQLIIQTIEKSIPKEINIVYEFVTTNVTHAQSFQKQMTSLVQVNRVFTTVSSHDAGFSELNNLVIQKHLKTLPNYFLLMNDDVFLHSSFFKNFSSLLKNATNEIVVPLVVDFYESLKRQKLIIDSYGVEYFRSGYAKNANILSTETRLFSASCLFLSGASVKKVVDQYGYLFNPILYYYLEDVELAMRTQIINLKIKKSTDLIAFHLGSTTSGKKGYFSMFQTYRNILWILILLWPVKLVVRNLPNILLVQFWTIYYASRNFGLGMYAKIIGQTLINLPRLLKYRKRYFKNQRHNSKQFSKILSKVAFRTYHGITIKAV